ncbi:MAG: hypothetical protein PHD09_03455 [Candidatus Omnitrophica bacterium]|jgi:hypothetical protein|nr:hypothetical protein [Candidatus Omnitrophota bacterium]
MKKNLIIFIAGVIFTMLLGATAMKLHLFSRGLEFYGKVRTKIEDTRFNRVPKETKELMLVDFEDPAEVKFFQLDNASMELSKKNASSGASSAKVIFHPGKQVSSIKLEDYFDRPGAIKNWAGYEGIAFTVFNPQPGRERIILQIKDKKGNKIKHDLFIEGNSTEEFEVEVARIRHSLNIYNIGNFTLFLWEPSKDKEFYLDNLRLVPYGNKDKKTMLSPDLLEDPAQAYALGDYFDFSKNKPKWLRSGDADNRYVEFSASLFNETAQDFLDLPFSSGVPFPRGELKDAGELRITDAQQQEVNFQGRPLCRWPDGSIKWLLVDLKKNVPAGQAEKLFLRYPLKNAAAAKDSPLKINEQTLKIEVVTGPLKFTVNKQSFNLFDRLWLDLNQDGKFQDDELITRDNDLLVGFRGGLYRASKTKDCKVIVEEKGPLKVVLKAEGWFADEKGKKFCKYVVRIQAFANSPIVRVYHTFIYTGYPQNSYHYLYKGKRLPQNETIQEISLDLPLGLKGEGLFSYAADKKVIQGKWDADVGLFQADYNKFSVMKSGNSIQTGEKLEGWLDISDSRMGMALGVKSLWQQFPKGFSLDKANNLLKLGLWPKEAPELDLKTTGAALGPDAVARGSAFGLGKTHELVFYFHGGEYKDSAVKSTMTGMLEPLLVRADPYWVSDTVAADRLLPYNPLLFRNAEETLNGLFNWADSQIDAFRWYGMIDFGDTLSWYRKDSYDQSYNEWGWHPVGRWGWFNCEGAGTHTGPLLLYLRSQNTKYFKFAENLSRHLMDVDTCHYNTIANDPRLKNKIFDDYSQPGSMHRHNGNHWGGRNEESTHTNLTGILLYYYITGYERAFDVAKEIGEFFLKEPITYFRHPDIAPQRGVANVLWGEVLLYEATGDPRFRQAADKWADVFYKGQNHNGSWAENYNPVEKSWYGDPRSDFMISYTLPGLIEYHKRTRNKAIKEAIIKAAEYLKGEEYQHHFDTLAYAFWLTGNKKFQDEGARRLESLIAHQSHSPDPLMKGMIYQKAYYARPAEFLYRTPFILEALTYQIEKKQ